MANTTAIDWMDVGLGWATLIATLGIVFVAYWAYRQARRSADASGETASTAKEELGLAKEEHEARMRPWVGMVDFCCDDETWFHLERWRLTLKNYGEMPAYDVIVIAEFHLTMDQTYGDQPGEEEESTVGDHKALQSTQRAGILYPKQERDLVFSFDTADARAIQAAFSVTVTNQVDYSAKFPSVKKFDEWWHYRIDVRGRRWYPQFEAPPRPPQ